MTLGKAAVFSFGTESSVTFDAAKPAKPSPLPARPVLKMSCSCPHAYVVFSRMLDARVPSGSLGAQICP